MPSKNQLALIDIQDAILAAQQFLADMPFDAFAASRLHVFAATRALEIVSEASRRLSPEFREQHPSLPWKKIMGAGNIYRHNYDNVEESMVWSAIKTDLPPLLAIVTRALEASCSVRPPTGTSRRRFHLDHRAARRIATPTSECGGGSLPPSASRWTAS